MKNLLQKIESFYIEITKKEETFKRRAIRPDQDWSVVLIINTIVFALLIVSSLYFYIQIKGDKLFTVTTTSTVEETKINTEKLEKIINELNLREESTNNIKKVGAGLPDPSM